MTSYGFPWSHYRHDLFGVKKMNFILCITLCYTLVYVGAIQFGRHHPDMSPDITSEKAGRLLSPTSPSEVPPRRDEGRVYFSPFLNELLCRYGG